LKIRVSVVRIRPQAPLSFILIAIWIRRSLVEILTKAPLT
jgi:hypothetical protein